MTQKQQEDLDFLIGVVMRLCAYQGNGLLVKELTPLFKKSIERDIKRSMEVKKI